MFSFSLGIQKLWPALSSMQATGLYWINCDRKTDANLLSKQTIKALPLQAKTALICVGEAPETILSALTEITVKSLPLFRLPEKKAALLQLTSDLVRALNTNQRLFILHINSSVWQNFSEQEIKYWIKSTSKWLNKEQATLLVLSYNTGISTLKTQLMPMHRHLDGFANLQWRQEGGLYTVAWWRAENEITSNKEIILQQNDLGYLVIADSMKPDKLLSITDESVFLSEKSLFEGAQAPTLNWTLFDNNEQVEQHAINAQAATLLFTLYNSAEVDHLAKQIHHLRLLCGSALKIVVREMGHHIRQSDEYLLQACGVNLILPACVSQAQCMMMIDGIQGQRLTRYVPEDFNLLLATLRAIQAKGILTPEEFCQAVLSRLNNSLALNDAKGILVSLSPVRGLSTSQALTLCSILRLGDIICDAGNQLYLFLSTCGKNDLHTALKFIFKLPIDEIFSSHEAWHQDSLILSEIKHLGSRKSKSKPIKFTPHEQDPSEHLPAVSPITPKTRRSPVPFSLKS